MPIIHQKGYEEIEGTSRYVLTFHNTYNDSKFYWIEGIGSTRSSFLTPLVTSGGHTELKECYQNDLCLYRYGSFSVVEKIEENHGLSIHDGLITLESSAKQNTITLYDMNGRRLKTASARERVVVSTADLQPGIYIAVPSSDGITSSPKKFSIN